MIANITVANRFVTLSASHYDSFVVVTYFCVCFILFLGGLACIEKHYKGGKRVGRDGML